MCHLRAVCATLPLLPRIQSGQKLVESKSYPVGYVVAQLVEALRYKPEGGEFVSRCGHWDFSMT